MKKLLVLLVIVSLFAGYGSVAMASQEPVTLELIYWGSEQQDGMNRAIAEFTAMNPHITIQSTLLPREQYWTKIQTSFPTQTVPDVFWINAAEGTTYINADLVMDLTDLIERDNVNMDDYPESVVQQYMKDGRYYGIPKDVQPVVLYYNKALFDEAGVAYPTNDWKWDDLVEAAKQLTKRSGDRIDQYGYVFRRNVVDGTYNYCYQSGGTLYRPDLTGAYVNTPENLEAFQFVYDLIYTHKVSPTGPDLEEINEEQTFISGMGAMMTSGLYMLETFSGALGDNLGVAAFPYNKERVTINNGLGYGIPANSRNKEAAWEFVKYLASKEGQEAQLYAVMPASKVVDADWQGRFPMVDFQVFLDTLDTGHMTPITDVNSALSRKIFEEELSAMMFDVKTPEQALADIEERIVTEAIGN